MSFFDPSAARQEISLEARCARDFLGLVSFRINLFVSPEIIFWITSEADLDLTISLLAANGESLIFWLGSRLFDSLNIF